MKSPLLIEDLTKAVHAKLTTSLTLVREKEFRAALETATRMLVPRETEKAAMAFRDVITEEQKSRGSLLATVLLEDSPIYMQWLNVRGHGFGCLVTKNTAWEIYIRGNDTTKPVIGGLMWCFNTHQCLSSIAEFPPDEDDEILTKKSVIKFYAILDLMANKKAVASPGPETHRFKGGKKILYPEYSEILLDPDGKLAEKLILEQISDSVEPNMPAVPQLPYWFEGDFVVTRCSVTKEDGRIYFPTNLRTDELAPKEIAKVFHAAGWDFDPYNAERIRSPAHAKITRIPRPKLTLVENKPMTSRIPPGELPLPRMLTPKERSAVRDLLDTHFDDEAGRYRNGYTDQGIGDELNIPYALVSGMREAAYGPIKSDPEIEAMEAAMELCKIEIDTAEDHLTKAMERLETARKEHDAIRGRLDTMAVRRKRTLA